MPTMSREERMRALTGEVPADVAGVVVLVNRLAAAVADVQQTLDRIEVGQVESDARPSAQTAIGISVDSRLAAIEKVLGDLSVRASDLSDRAYATATRVLEVQERVAELATASDELDPLLRGLLDKVAALEAWAAAAEERAGARHADIQMALQGFALQLSRVPAEPAPVVPEPSVIPDPGGEFVDVAPSKPAATLDDLADLLVEGQPDVAPADDGSAS